MYSEDILDCGQAREKCTKLIEHFCLDPKLFPGVSVYFLNQTKLFCGKYQVVKQKKEKILFSLLKVISHLSSFAKVIIKWRK